MTSNQRYIMLFPENAGFDVARRVRIFVASGLSSRYFFLLQHLGTMPISNRSAKTTTTGTPAFDIDYHNPQKEDGMTGL